MVVGEVSDRIRKALIRRIKKTFVGLVKEPKDVLIETIEATREIAAITFRGNKQKRKRVSQQLTGEIVSGAIEAGSKTGININSVAKGAVMGTVKGVSEVTEVKEELISDTSKTALLETSKAGGNLVTSARKILEGAVEVADQVGFKAEDAASAAAAGLLRAAEEIGASAMTAVTKVISGTIFGVRIALGVPHVKSTIMVINSNHNDLKLISENLEQEGYDTLTATNLTELDKAVTSKRKIALALIDLTGFDQLIWERCDKLRRKKVPFIVISPQRSPTVQRDSMSSGASGLLVKPVSNKELTEYIHTLLGD